MWVEISTLTTKLHNRGYAFNDFFHTSTSKVLGMLFYDTNSLWSPSGDLMPKELANNTQLMEDGYTMKWRDLDWRRQGTTLAGALTVGNTTMNVATWTGALFNAWDLIFSPTTFERFIVTAVSTDALTITPAVAAAWIVDNAQIEILSHAIDNQGALNGKAVSIEAGDEMNNVITHKSYSVEFTQEKLNSIILKYTQANKSEEEAVKDFVNDHFMKAKQEIQRDVLRDFYFARKGNATIDGKVHRYAGGFEDFRDSTVVDVATESTAKAKLNKLIDAMDDVARVAPVSKVAKVVCVVNEKAHKEISGWILDLNLQRFTKEVTSLGWYITVIKSSHWEVALMTCPELDQMTTSLTNGVGFIFSPELVAVTGATKMLLPWWPWESKELVPVTKPWMVIYIPEGERKQPNSPTKVNLYTNYSFIFKGASLNLFKRVKF